MRSRVRQTRENRTITVDFQNEATYVQLLGDGKAFVELVMAFILSLGFQLKHKATCQGGGCLTRHSHYVRVRLGGVTIWRIQCTTCRAVFTVLPHFVLRYRQMRPDVARDGSCTCALRINPPGSPVDHHRGKKAYKRGLSGPPSGPLSPGEALDAGPTDTRRHLRLSSLAASHPPRR